MEKFNKKITKQRNFAPIFLIGGVFVLCFAFAGTAHAATLTWTQSSWRGEATSTTAIYPTDQINWINYSSATNIASSSLVASSGLISFWPFNGNANDSVGSNNGVASGSPAFVTGVSGQAYSFDGDNDYVEVPDSDSLDLTSDFTISTWFKKSENGRIETILDKGLYNLGVNADGRIFFNLSADTGTSSNVGTLEGNTAVAFAAHNNSLYAATSNGRIYKYLGGSSWSFLKVVNNYGIYGIASMVSFNGKLYVLTEGEGVIYVYDDVNDSWQTITTPGPARSAAVWNNDLYIGMNEGTHSLYRYEGGNSWELLYALPTGTYLNTLMVFNGSLYVGGGDDGKIWRYDPGVGLTEVGDTTADWTTAMGEYKGSMYAGFYGSNTIYRYDGGTTWTSVGTPTGGGGIWSLISYGGDLYASGPTTYLNKYGGGTTWTQIGAVQGERSIIYKGKIYSGKGTVYSYGEGAGLFSTSAIGDDWNYVAVSYSAATAVLSLRLNGQLEATTSVDFALATSSNDLFIGKGYGTFTGNSGSSGEQNFKGLIDEVKIYSRALSAEEISGNYLTEKNGENKIFLTKAAAAVSHTADADFAGTNDQTVVLSNSIILASSSGYYATGTYVSQAINIPNLNFGSADWTSILPASTTLAVKFRTATTSDMAAAAPWVNCQQYWNGLDISNSSCVADGHPYLQYRLEMSTASSSATPQLSDITLNYNRYNTSGNLVSSAFDWGSDDSYLESLSWAESLSSGTNALVSLRTASTTVNLSSASWSEISRGDCSIVGGTATCASSSLPAAMKDGVADRLVQYKINFTGSGSSTPQLSQVYLAADDEVATAAPTQIYRSAGPGNTNELASGTISFLLTISSSTATFSGGTLPFNIGAGDAIVYDSDDSGTLTAADDIVFIHGRSSSTAYTVKDQFGANTATTTTGNDVWAVYRAYTSLANAEAGTKNTSLSSLGITYDSWSDGKDLTAATGANQVWNIACYADATDTAAVTVDGWTTGPDNYLRIYTPYLSSEVGASQRHFGKWDDGKYSLAPATNNNTLTIADSFVRIEGLQIKSTSYNSPGHRAIRVYDSVIFPQGIYISNNIIKEGNVGQTGGKGIELNLRSDATYSNNVFNNLVYNFTSFSIQTYGESATAKQNLFNNTALFAGSYSFDDFSGTSAVLKNNLSYNEVGDYCPTGVNASSTNNAYIINAPAGAGNNINLGIACGGSACASTTIFMDPANEDFRLKAGSPVINAGINLADDRGFSFNYDYQEEARGPAWDVGADEYYDLTAPEISSIASSTTAYTATITWTTDEEATSTVSYGLTSAYGSASSSDIFASTTHSITLHGLTASATYHFQISSTDASGNRATSSDYTLTTDAAPPATQIYRSVGPANTSALASGDVAFLLTIGGGTATFSGGTLPLNVGVGDVIVYDSDDSGTLTAADDIVFIHGRSSSTSYTVKDETGVNTATTTAANDTWAVYRSYTSLAKAVGLNTGNSPYLTPNTAIPVIFDDQLGIKNISTNATGTNKIWNVACYADAPDNNNGNAVSTVGWTTDADNYLRIYTPYLASEVGTSQRHSGIWDNSKYNLTDSSAMQVLAILYIYSAYTRVDGLQIKSATSPQFAGYSYGIYLADSNPGGSMISNNIIKEGNASCTYDSGVYSLQNPIYLYNNIIYGFKGDHSSGIGNTASVAYVYNNTVSDSYYGITTSYEGALPMNNLVFDNAFDYDGIYLADLDYNAYGNSSPYYEGSGARNEHGLNLSGIATSTIFADAAGEDFRLAYGAPLINAGTSLSADPHLSFNTDIQNQSRPYGTAWDVGADEFDHPLIYSIGTTTTSYTATITWTTDVSASSTVSYGTSASYDLASSSDELVTPHSITLHGLSSSTTYHFQISSTDASGNRATSSDKTFRTSDIAPPEISSIATSTTATTATITWTTNELASSTVSYGTSTSYGLASSSDELVTPHSITLHGLTASTTYHFRVESADASGNRATTSDHAFTTAEAPATTSIYYSVGQTTADHKTGSPTITIVDGVATFSEAQTAANFGVGDKISYGSAEATTTVYISAKQSTLVWNVITATGGEPEATTTSLVLKISHVFSSLAEALPAGAGGAKGAAYLNTSDLTAGNYVLNIPCYYDTGADTAVVTVDGWTTGADNYIKIYTPNDTATEVNQSQRHSGVWDDDKYQLVIADAASGTIITVKEDYVRIAGLQLRFLADSSSGNDFGIWGNAGGSDVDFRVSNNIIRGTYNAGGYLVGIVPAYEAGSGVVKVWNNLIYDFTGTHGQAFEIEDLEFFGYIYNNTTVNNDIGIRDHASDGSVVKNNLSCFNTDDFDVPRASSSVNNAYSQGIDPGENGLDISAYASTTIFVNPSSGDFRLKAGSPVIDQGVNLSADSIIPFNYDIQNQARPFGSAWDIGADEYYDLTAPVISNIATSTSGTTATITWTTNEVASSTVSYGTSISYGLASSSDELVTPHSITLHGLTASTTYHFRVESADASGNRATSSDKTFRTSDIAPPEISSIATSTTATTATITWTTNEVASSTVSYGTSTSYGLASSSDELVTPHSITLHGLTASTTYHFRVESTDASGNRATSSDYTFTTNAAAPATQIYRSVGVGGENEIASGTITALLTIDGSGNLTFSGTTMPDRVGVGDAIVYDSDDSGTLTAADDIVFIYSRSSSTAYTVKDQFGANTATTTTGNDTWAVYRAYTSLSKAEASTNNTSILPSYDTWSGGRNISQNATGTNEIWNIACYGDATDTVAVIVDGWTTATTSYLRFYTPYLPSEVGTSQRHSGVWDINKYHLVDGESIRLNSSHVRIEGLQIRSNGGAGIDNFDGPYDDIYIYNNIVRGSATVTGGYNWGIWLENSTAINQNFVYNNIVYDFIDTYGYGLYSSSLTSLYNNTVSKNTNGITSYSGKAWNNLSFDNTTDYTGTFNNDSDYNAYGNTAPNFSGGGTNNAHGLNLSGYASTSIFANPANDNYLLKAGSPAINVGANLSADPDLPFDYDIQNQARPNGAAWDIGADEYYDLTAPIISNIATSTAGSAATITWTTDEDATSTVSYGLSSAYGLASSSDVFASSSHSITLHGLSSGATYHFQISSADASGNRATTSDRLLYISDFAPPVISSIATSTTATTATITWTTNEVASSTVSYGTSTSYGLASSSDELVTPHSITLRGLSSNTTYHYRVESADASGNRATSSDKTFRTSDIAPPVISSIATSTTATTATITWTTNEVASSTVSYGTSTSYGLASSSDELVTPHSIILHGLTASTTYHFRVESTDASGNRATSSNHVLRTTAITYTLTYAAGAHGLITGSSTQTVNLGADGSAVIPAPDIGYHFVNWSDSSTSSPRTDTNVTGNISVTATFAINTYTITASTGAHGTVLPGGVTTKNYGDSQIYTIATSTAGYHVADILVDSVSVGTSSLTYTFTDIQANHTISATFAISTYTVGGTVSGLNGTVALQNNGGDNLSISANGSFVFATALANSASYAVTISGNPSGQTCSVSSGSGILSNANVSSVLISCANNSVAPGGGGGGSSVDITPPGMPANFAATSSGARIILSWTNPTDSDFAGVKLYRKIGSTLTGQNDALAQLIYQGKAKSFTDTATSGLLYYYSLYSYDARPNYSQPRTIFIYLSAAQGISTSSVPILPPVAANPINNPVSNIPGIITSLIGADSAAVNKVTADEAKDLLAEAGFDNLSEVEKNIYSRIIALADKPLSPENKNIIACFIHQGTPTTKFLGAGERGGTIASFQTAFGHLPETLAEWQDVIKIGNGRWPSAENKEALRLAKVSFQNIYFRPADMNNRLDNAAVTIMAYGLRPAARKFASEKAAIISYHWIYKRYPATARAWDAVRAIAYSGARR
ncbi:MAG: choice-of-anchor Q domain-containing protein [Patescibacteria group bacterium]|nr:choice-of-anchor Q domain-containing protein [Patescibacteria group bacterium]